jgi:PHD/YefM family antitoxin component YafN of YafNO toxin-antitoxin module
MKSVPFDSVLVITYRKVHGQLEVCQACQGKAQKDLLFRSFLCTMICTGRSEAQMDNLQEKRNTLSIVEAREQLTRLPERFEEELHTNKHLSAIKVTRHNKPVLAILPWELYESIVETLEILGDEELMADLRQSIQEASEDKGEPWEAVKKDLGWA